VGISGAEHARASVVSLEAKKIGTVPFLPQTDVTSCEGGGCINRDLLRNVIRSHMEQVRYCYELALGRNPGLEGKVKMQIQISEAGRVRAALVLEGIAGQDELSDCIASRIRTWVFPRLKSEVTVTYPFVFRRGI
jgi:outer membrane biosynthesis protein TonB